VVLGYNYVLNILGATWTAFVATAETP
jgi:hypothetical protein